MLEYLHGALGGDGADEARSASAVRLRLRLQPAGGAGSKVMPPTYAGERGPVYLRERRRVDGELRDCVLLDSVASQANRMEEALVERALRGELALPTILVDQREFGVHSALEFSHRCFDAWVEDALLDGEPFGTTPLYRALVSVPTRHRATPLMERFPAVLVHGGWASREHNPQGATRIARALTSEIVAVDAVEGARPASRIDLHHVSNRIAIYETEGARFTTDAEQATTERGKPKPFRKGTPSEAGYGNVPPSVVEPGGVTMDHALQIVTLSMPALRECRFPSDEAGSASERDVAGRTMLAALGVRMLALLVERGYDLRSGCLLVPEGEPAVELVGRLGKTVASWELFGLDTGALLDRAVADGARHGLDWSADPISLEASVAQLELLGRSLSAREEE